MLKPTVFGFLLCISVVAGGVMLFSSEPPNPQPSIVSLPSEPAYENHIQALNGQAKTEQSISDATQSIIGHLEKIEKLLSTSSNDTPTLPRTVDGPNGTSTAPYGLMVSVALIIAMVIFAPALVMFWLRRHPTIAKIAGGLTAAIALGGITIFSTKIEKLNLNFPSDHQTSPPTEQSITLHLPEFQTTETELDCGQKIVDNDPFTNPFRIGPFPDGLATTAEIKGTPSENVRKSFEQLTRKIDSVIPVLAQDQNGAQKDKADKSLIAVLLIGSADKRALGETTESYRSNVGLAQARAGWVQERLESNAILRKKPIITLNSGPSFSLIAIDNDSAKLALDRAVQVCALWQKKL